MDRPSFAVDGHLAAAHLSVTMNLYDFLTGAQLPVVYDLSWNATTQPYSLKGREQYKAPGVLIKESFNTTQRDATVSGSVMIGGVNATPAPHVRRHRRREGRRLASLPLRTSSGGGWGCCDHGVAVS